MSCAALRTSGALVSFLLLTAAALADAPSVAYIFPAGAQRGTTVEARIGGHFLYDAPSFDMEGPGIEAPKTLGRIETIWFEGPLIPQPASQKQEDYPQDYGATIRIAADAPLGPHYWRAGTSQGVTPGQKFVVGDLPEIVEQELDGRPIPTAVTLPVTINGRIFPREDVDIWTFDAQTGQVITCEVLAARIGSPLDSRLEVRDPQGRRIAENVDTFGTDSFVRFTAPIAGSYALHIHDINFEGLQQYVYRLTISSGPYVDFVYPLGGRRGNSVSLELHGANLPQPTAAVALPADPAQYFHWRLQSGTAWSNALPLELSDLPEVLEQEPNDEAVAVAKFSIPAVLNGRIEKPDDADSWAFDAKKDEQLQFDLRAGRLGSLLDSVLTIVDATGKQLATSDDLAAGNTDSQISFKVPADGVYTVRVSERIESRGGSQFAYRLYVTPDDGGPDFGLTVAQDVIVVERGKQVQVKVDVQRSPGFQEEIELSFQNLPEGIEVSGNKVGKGRPNTQIVLKASETVPLQTLKTKLIGKAIIGSPDKQQKPDKKKPQPQQPETPQPEPREIVRTATLPVSPGETPRETLTLAVAVPTPFKFTAPFESKFAPRGSVYVRRYQIDRGGFDGPIEISLADRQNRHLQGTSGPTIVVPPGVSEFDYPLTLPPWMEIGRTSRTCLMAVGVVEDEQGHKHKVSYSSQQQDDQIIVLVAPLRLTIETPQTTLRSKPGATSNVSVHVGRGTGLKGPVTVELAVSRHIHGVMGDTITIDAGQETGELPVRFTDGPLGPFNMPLTIRATMTDERGYPLTAETPLEIVSD